MTTIPLALIRPSPHPVRTSWDEDKLNELAASMAKQGLIVPVKVRENADGFEIVYGHRRVEAARRNGWGKIDALVEGMDDTDALIQALIENVQREDMSDADQGAGFKRLRDEFDLTIDEIAARTGKSERHIRDCIALVEDESAEPLVRDHALRDAAQKATAIRARLRDRPDVARAVAEKAAAEGLSAPTIRKVADSVAAASPEQREAILSEPFGGPRSTYLHDPEWVKERSRDFGPRVQDLMPVQPEAVPAEAREAFAWAKAIGSGRDNIESSAKHGKLAPEHIRKLADLVRGRCKTLTEWAENLEGNYGDVG